MTEPARCVWCKVAVEGQFSLGSACPHCGKAPLLLEGIPEVRQEHSYGNEPTRDPELEGLGGRAWRPVVRRPGPQTASVGSDWLVHAPGWHPFWWWYMVAVVHLRPLDGAPANMQFPGATHEFMVVALDPEKPLADVDDWAGASYLTPPNIMEQFIVGDDAQAKELGDDLVAHMVSDAVSADEDFRSYWRELVANSAEHLRLGGHPDRDG